MATTYNTSSYQTSATTSAYNTVGSYPSISAKSYHKPESTSKGAKKKFRAFARLFFGIQFLLLSVIVCWALYGVSLGANYDFWLNLFHEEAPRAEQLLIRLQEFYLMIPL